jgi:hypothetical protein
MTSEQINAVKELILCLMKARGRKINELAERIKDTADADLGIFPIIRG